MRSTVIVMLKAPIAGRVKTRLAATLGEARAAAIYRELLTRTLQRTRGPWRRVLAFSDACDRHWNLPETARDDFRVAQGPGDLGARMRRVMEIFPSGPIMIIGTDCPTLSRREILKGFARLRGADAALGPAVDGGFWTVGFARRRPLSLPPGVFHRVRWSGPHALADTRKSFPRAWRVSELALKSDVDEGNDLERLTLRATANSFSEVAGA